MTDRDWNAPETTARIHRFLRAHASDRKLNTYLLAICRRLRPLLAHPASREAVDVLEKFLDGTATVQELREAKNRAHRAGDALYYQRLREDPEVAEWVHDTESAIHAPDLQHASFLQPTAGDMLGLLEAAAHFIARCCWPMSPAQRRRTIELWMQDPQFRQRELFLEIFGDPFHPARFDPRWRTSTTTAIAQGMYETSDFATMPILADALEDAGCDDSAILAHGRGPGPHLRGCWVVDLVLGRD